MTLQERWQRFNRPTCAEDYQLSFTSAELRQFPEGRAVLAEILRAKRQRDQSGRMARRMGLAVRDFLVAMVLVRSMTRQSAHESDVFSFNGGEHSYRFPAS